MIIHKEKLRKIVPLWTELSLKMKGNRLIDKVRPVHRPLGFPLLRAVSAAC